ncbi:MAG: UDP-N-acetylmuramoyl-tripeptide--D-alanyl-D-alanine ligase [Flavobacterium sp.]
MKTIKEIHDCYLSCVNVVIDTRKIINGSLFVALRGANVDGNDFALQALNAGAYYALIDRDDCYVDDRTILVENSLKTLQELATFHREFLKIPIIGLTGSNGKTTTKELFLRVLQKKYNTCATVGNLNNHIGVPLTLLSFTSDTEIGIVEMGANHQKEIAFLSSIAKPDVGYITNFGKAHLEGFGGVEGVIKGKSELYDFIKLNKGQLLVNIDDPIQEEKTRGFDRFTFSFIDVAADVYLKFQMVDNFVVITHDHTVISTNLIGSYNASNIAAAIALGIYFNIEIHLIKEAIESYSPDNNRSQVLQHGEHRVILDAYNANPSSMEVAIQNFGLMEYSSKMMILGDMFELGEESPLEHHRIAELALGLNDVTTYFVGEHFFKSSKEFELSKVNFFHDFDSLVEELRLHPIKKSLLLIKGSRGMALERVLNYL